MMEELPEKSIFKIIKTRSDTHFSGFIVENKANYSEREIIESSSGHEIHHSHDYIRTIDRNGIEVGIIAADASDSNINVDHPYWYLPHLSAIYVKEDYRNQGIATKLVTEFLNKVERVRIVADYDPSLEEFYNQLDAEVIQLGQFKDGIDL